MSESKERGRFHRPETWGDQRVIEAYETWSEEAYAAGFMHADAPIVAQFIRWLNEPRQGVGERTDYELAMLAEFRLQMPEPERPSWWRRLARRYRQNRRHACAVHPYGVCESVPRRFRGD